MLIIDDNFESLQKILNNVSKRSESFSKMDSNEDDSNVDFWGGGWGLDENSLVLQVLWFGGSFCGIKPRLKIFGNYLPFVKFSLGQIKIFLGGKGKRGNLGERQLILEKALMILEGLTGFAKSEREVGRILDVCPDFVDVLQRTSQLGGQSGLVIGKSVTCLINVTALCSDDFVGLVSLEQNSRARKDVKVRTRVDR